jgi:hypothetical protein
MMSALFLEGDEQGRRKPPDDGWKTTALHTRMVSGPTGKRTGRGSAGRCPARHPSLTLAAAYTAGERFRHGIPPVMVPLAHAF